MSVWRFVLWIPLGLQAWLKNNYSISPVGAGHNLIIDILVVVEVLEAEVEDAVRAGSGDGGQAEEDDQLCEGGPGQYGKQLDVNYSTMC